ncbi:MAG: ureidoglycolate lyase [Alkalispirochaeta sp.]
MEKKLSIEEATASSLEKYGELLTNADTAPAADNDVFAFWNDVSVGDFEGAASFGMVHTKPGDLRVPMLERHVRTTETLVPLDEDIVLVLAEPSSGELPDLETARAFKIPRGAGITLKRGTWHYVPLVPSKIDARTLVVFRQGTPAEDLEVRQLADEFGTTIEVMQ